ncbi:TonB-dependent receptor [Brevundimonas lenta]|uniref:Iron complex outermembrane receptor protein n=1 Tax=Brevundimonas lenta TaxID=424796 RepID=A0A7W6NNN2_9CAUL|nr:TonB-dependent receptor [Brevundimonas lenta]MBB4081948.1 iron complex outermembrane receptor protein [Brevundimonas lenta]
MSRKLWITASAAALLFAAGAANAQDARPANQNTQDEQADTLDDVVVTAERRTTNLQETAVAATVLSGEDLENRGVTSLEQLQFVAPSTTVQNFGQGNFFNVRGIGKSEPTTAIGVGVTTYRDGVAVFPGYFQTEPYYDIGSVELLRGPQGTFAGTNATGGAVFINARNPDFTGVNGYVMGQAGTYGNLKLQGAINVPISDTLAARFALNSEIRDSFHEITGTYSGHPGEIDSKSYRASVLWTPTPALRVLLKGDYNNLDFGGYPADPALATNDPFKITANGPHSGHDETARVSLNVSYVLDNGITLRSITGYQDGISEFSTDLDGTSALNNTFYDRVEEEVWSQEFNIVSPDDQRLTWILGAFWQYDDVVFPVTTFPQGAYHVGFPEGVVDYYIFGETPKETQAVFGQISYDVSENLQIQLGARWSESTSTNDNVYTTYPAFGLTLLQNDEVTAEKTTGKLSVNYKLDDNNFVYGFVATGFKMGGLNAPNFYVPASSFGPEDVIDYELGWKSTMFDGRVRTQLGAYYMVYEGFQVIVGDPTVPLFNSIVNVNGETVLKGIEASAQARFGQWSVDVGGSLSSSELGQFYAVDPRLARLPCNPQTGPAAGNCQNLEGNSQSYAPELTFNAGLQYEFALEGGAILTPRIDYSHIGESWTSIFNNEALGDKLEARNIVNLKLTYQLDEWTLAAYALNATDQTYIAAVNAGLRYAGPPRQIGLNLMRTF